MSVIPAHSAAPVQHVVVFRWASTATAEQVTPHLAEKHICQFRLP